VARHLWVEADDRIAADATQPVAGVTTIVCSWPADHAARAGALARMISPQVTTILIQGTCEAPAGFVGASGAIAGWNVFSRSTADS
jgi:hypothetical protein